MSTIPARSRIIVPCLKIMFNRPNIIEYNQKLIGENSCTYLAILTNISNVWQKELSLVEQKKMYSDVGVEGRGSLPLTAIKKVVDRWNKNYPKMKV